MRMSHDIEDVFPVGHYLVEFAELAVSQILVEPQAPLASAEMHTKVVPRTWKVDPLGVTEFVSHEVEVAFSTKTDAEQSDHLVKGHSSANFDRSVADV